MNPLVSIIVPTYNRAHLIGETLQSVLDQTYQNWECIVVDDLSTDSTDEVLKSWTEKDNRFKYFKRHREPKGAPTCRNIGLDKAEGEYVIFLDSDDLLADFCLERRVKAFTKKQNCDFLVFSTVEFKEQPGDTNILVNIETAQDPILRFFNLDIPWITLSPIWKIESLRRLGGWNEKRLSWQDWELHLKALFLDFKYQYFKLADSFLRRNTAYRTIGVESVSFRHLASHLDLLSDLKKYIVHNPDYRKSFVILIDWIAFKAIEIGNRKIALKAVLMSLKLRPNLKDIINIFSISFNRKITFLNKEYPDFGSMRKTFLSL